jgi:hypothetical protein
MNCINCHHNYAYPGYQLCQTCYFATLPVNKCTNCYANNCTDGYTLCKKCYRQSVVPVDGQHLCRICNNKAFYSRDRNGNRVVNLGCTRAHTQQAIASGYRFPQKKSKL